MDENGLKGNVYISEYSLLPDFLFHYYYEGVELILSEYGWIIDSIRRPYNLDVLYTDFFQEDE